MSLADVANALEQPAARSQIQRLETGEVEMTRAWAERLAPIVGVSRDVLMFGERVPVVGAVDGPGRVQLRDDLGSVKMPPHGTKHTVALKINSDRLGYLLRGWYAYYNASPTKPIEELIARKALCVVSVIEPAGTSKVYIRRLAPGRIGGHYDLYDDTGPLQDQKVEWACEVISLTPGHLADHEPSPLTESRDRD
jgi:hypothetical protein